MDALDPTNICVKRIYRDDCVQIDDVYAKDLSMLGRRMEDIILIDNSPHSYSLQPENAIPISSWYGDVKDTELSKLTKLLVGLSKVPDVRKVLSISHKNHKMNLVMAEKFVKQILDINMGNDETAQEGLYYNQPL